VANFEVKYSNDSALVGATPFYEQKYSNKGVLVLVGPVRYENKHSIDSSLELADQPLNSTPSVVITSVSQRVIP